MPRQRASALDQALQALAKEGAIQRVPVTESFFKPQLAQLSEEIPTGPNWLFENKFDGYRILAFKKAGHFVLYSRNGLDWTARFPDIVRALTTVEGDTFILDGEMVVEDAQGKSSFGALQQRLSDNGEGFHYFVFDLLYVNGYDVRSLSLLLRRRLLQHVLSQTLKNPKGKRKGAIHYSESTDNGNKLYALAKKNGLEGIIAKNIHAPYRGRRHADWVKIKCLHEDEFVIGGYTDPQGSRQGFGSLLMGYYDPEGNFIYTGKVGTGFADTSLNELLARLEGNKIPKSPFLVPLTGLERHNAHFVRPTLVAQLSYTEWTPDGRLRHPVFLGLREDKAAREVGDPRRALRAPTKAPKKPRPKANAKGRKKA